MAVDFGKDVSATDTLRTGRLVTGARLVAEAAYRRLTTPHGKLIGGVEEENYGLDLRTLIGAANPTAMAASLPGRIRTELLKDDRINSVKVDVVVTRNGPGTEIDIAIECQTDAGPFGLKLAVSDVDVTLVGLNAEAA